MRFVILAALTAMGTCAFGQSVTLVATLDGKPVGSGTFTISTGLNHSYVQSTVFNIDRDGQKETLSSVVKVSFDGYTLQDDEKDVVNGKVQRNLSVAFTIRSATVTDVVTGKKSTINVPGGAAIKDLSGLWFISIRPHAGAVSTATAFATDSLTWKKTTRTYVGDEPATLKGLKVMGHKLQDSDGSQTIVTVVDDHGLPISMDVAGFHFARK